MPGIINLIDDKAALLQQGFQGIQRKKLQMGTIENTSLFITKITGQQFKTHRGVCYVRYR